MARNYKRKVAVREVESGERRRCVLFSYQFLDRNQGQSYDEWQEAGLLSLAMDKFREISTLTMGQATASQAIKVYGGFPPGSSFTKPIFVT